MGNDPRYNKTRCFEPFPFPAATEGAAGAYPRPGPSSWTRTAKRQQAAHPKLVLTDIYNVLEKLRDGVALNAREKVTHEQGLVSVLRQIHDELDAAVFDAYGWLDPPTAVREGQVAGPGGALTDAEILARLVPSTRRA